MKSRRAVPSQCRGRIPCGRRSGFTLVETVIACAIVIMVLAGSYLILDASMNLLRTVRDAYAASTITNARLERARLIPVTDLAQLAESETLVDDYGLPTTGGRFRRTTVVSTNQPSFGCTQVVVTTDVKQPKKTPVVYYNRRSMIGVFTLYDQAP
jgi:type II secretory pathway pseudopilin PulG